MAAMDWTRYGATTFIMPCMRSSPVSERAITRALVSPIRLPAHCARDTFTKASIILSGMLREVPARRLAAALLLLAPHTPLLFMGEEFDEKAPFQFFADFQDPELRKAVSEGRRSEFKDFNFSEVPDPEDPETFERSKLTWATAPESQEMLGWYRHLLQLRKQHVTAGERTADAQYADGVLTMQVPATNPKVMVQAALEDGRSLPEVRDGGRDVLFSEEDGYAVRVRVRVR